MFNVGDIVRISTEATAFGGGGKPDWYNEHMKKYFDTVSIIKYAIIDTSNGKYFYILESNDFIWPEYMLRQIPTGSLVTTRGLIARYKEGDKVIIIDVDSVPDVAEKAKTSLFNLYDRLKSVEGMHATIRNMMWDGPRAKYQLNLPGTSMEIARVKNIYFDERLLWPDSAPVSAGYWADVLQAMADSFGIILMSDIQIAAKHL